MLSVELGCDDFTASNGWLEAWRRRHNVKFAVLSGESAEVPQAAIDDWTKRLPDIIKGYALSDIFNCDETGLYYRALPKQSMIIKGDSSKGVKTAKERITVLLACSATGEKLKPLVIGRAENPRCLKYVDKASMPVIYHWNKKSWMTATIFEGWLHKIDNRMMAQGRHILLLLDNCGAHPRIVLRNVKLQFLPPNTTSKLQPLDAGIISTLKALYRKRLLRHLCAEMDEANTATELAKSVTMLDAIRWVDLAWTGVKPTSISKCFAHCGIAVAQSCSQDEEPLPALEGPYHELLDGAKWEEFVNMDDNAVTTSADSASLPVHTPPEPDDEEAEQQEEEAEQQEERVISSKEALAQTKSLLRFATAQGQTDMVESLLRVKSCVEDIRIKEKGKVAQKTIKDFFVSAPSTEK